MGDLGISASLIWANGIAEVLLELPKTFLRNEVGNYQSEVHEYSDQD